MSAWLEEMEEKYTQVEHHRLEEAHKIAPAIAHAKRISRISEVIPPPKQSLRNWAISHDLVFIFLWSILIPLSFIIMRHDRCPLCNAKVGSKIYHGDFSDYEYWKCPDCEYEYAEESN